MRALLVAVAVIVSSQASDPYSIVPGRSFGPLRESTTRAELVKLFPAAAVVDAQIELAEGFCTSGTKVFGGTPNAIDISWQDQARTRIAFVRTRERGGAWHTPAGARIGTLLTDLEKIAGSVLTFSGFGWDYGGALGWQEGGGELPLRIGADYEENSGDPEAIMSSEIEGERVVRSDHPMVRRLKIRVEEMMMVWGGDFEQFECR